MFPPQVDGLTVTGLSAGALLPGAVDGHVNAGLFDPMLGVTPPPTPLLSCGALLLGAVDGHVNAGLFDPMLGATPPPTPLLSIDRSGGGEDGLAEGNGSAEGGRDVCSDNVLVASIFKTMLSSPKFCITRHRT